MRLMNLKSIKLILRNADTFYRFVRKETSPDMGLFFCQIRFFVTSAGSFLKFVMFNHSWVDSSVF